MTDITPELETRVAALEGALQNEIRELSESRIALKQELVGLTSELIGAAGTLSAKVEHLDQTYQRKFDIERNRRRLLTLALAGLAVLTVALGVFGYLSVDNANTQRAELRAQARETALNQCVNGNKGRESIKNSFEILIGYLVPAERPEGTEPERYERAQEQARLFRADLDRELAPRDCDQAVATFDQALADG